MRKEWQKTSHPARLWSRMEDGRILCGLCSQQCKIEKGRTGTCRVRRHEEEGLVSLNYGKSVPITQETIETEAVYHYAPGEAILSLGNIGCMLQCDFCQNWSTSQARLVQDEHIVRYSAEQIVSYALAHDIRVLSWTYNDPVVWHEFVMDTATLARQHGLKNLYKSAFYIGEKAIDELLDVMDIFSVSLKSMQKSFYRKFTAGRLDPVLDGIKQVYEARKSRGAEALHLEVSNLCVTGRNDTLVESRKVTDWMLDHLDPDIPLHYVRFHPDYRYTGVERTAVSFLEEARTEALRAGMRYVYVGNVYGTPSANSFCPACQALWVRRDGLNAQSFLQDGRCPGCGVRSPLVLPWQQASTPPPVVIPAHFKRLTHMFRGPIQAYHIEQTQETPLFYHFVTASGTPVGEIGSNSCTRFMLSRSHEESAGLCLYHADEHPPQVFEVYDRAHFPTLAAEKTRMGSENIPPAMAPCR